MTRRRQLVVVGNGMVGHRLVDELVRRDGGHPWTITVIGGERRAAYDRVALSSWFAGRDAAALALADEETYGEQQVRLHLGDPVTAIDRAARVVRTRSGGAVSYDHLVLATGSHPFVPPVPGRDHRGCHVYRTIDDLEAIAAHAERPEVRAGVVIGGGLLGLEAANALDQLGLETHVVEFADRLMPQQLDPAGARALRDRIEDLGISVHTSHATTAIEADGAGQVRRLTFAEHAPIDAQVVVFSAGIRPADDLARAAGLTIGERGGIVVDGHLTTSDPEISAIGECALAGGRTWGLVGPGYTMARTLAERLCGGDPEPFVGADTSTKLKLLGIDVASFGDAFASGDGHHELVWDDARARTYRKVVVCASTGEVRGGMLVGDATAYAELAAMARGDLPTPGEPARLLPPGDLGGPGGAGAAGGPGAGGSALPDAAVVCSCENVTAGTLRDAIADGAADLTSLKACTRAGTGCGGCLPQATTILRSQLEQSGISLSRALCEHFEHSRQELFALVRVRRHDSFAAVLAAHGRPGAVEGCETCKPTVASILATIGTGHILDGDRAAIQDTNDFALANIQRNGTYSVVPRIPGGEITPAALIALGEVARDFGLYTKITGGQRIDLFGAPIEQLPAIWRRLVDAGFESGHAYGKALRTVKSCVGETWCRYGVQDSTTLAILLELRYRGLRTPHKVKMAVSGCARECAEAQSKDIGVIATERGWNLYVAGNGGKTPRHADLLATDLDTDGLLRLVDRFLMFYARTADRLERTSTWFENLDGAVPERLAWLREVLVDDALGICDELDADIAQHVATYECEWRATLEDPERLRRFVSFVNAPDEPDPTVRVTHERGQIRPAPLPSEVAVELR